MKKYSKGFKVTDGATCQQAQMQSTVEMTILGVEFSAEFARVLVFASGA